MNEKMIPFNRPLHTGKEDEHVLAAMRGNKLSGDGPYGSRCQEWFEQKLGCARAMLTPSCTQALEMAALLIDVRPGDEVIMPSFTFVSTANPFVLRGAKIVFVDIRPDTLNMDERLIEAAITGRTKAIVPVHYAGIGCEMDVIMEIASRYGLFVIEDAAQGMLAEYKGRQLGTLGHMAAYSFHETKNFTSGGEGGLLIVNDEQFARQAEIIREKGTNRSQFFRGEVDKYSWVDMGSSYLPSEIQAAYLWGQLEQADAITEHRRAIWERYRTGLAGLAGSGAVELPVVPEGREHNGHLFYLKVRDLAQRTALIEHLKADGVHAVFHYVPLHSAPAGLRFGCFHGSDTFTTRESDRLLRLPLWHGLDETATAHVVQSVKRFFKA